jgi:UMP-CMP kinase
LPLLHLSIGDVLREEMAIDGSPYADIIRENMAAGRVGPPELTVGLFRRRMEVAITKGIYAFVLDGRSVVCAASSLFPSSRGASKTGDGQMCQT